MQLLILVSCFRLSGVCVLHRGSDTHRRRRRRDINRTDTDGFWQHSLRWTSARSLDLVVTVQGHRRSSSVQRRTDRLHLWRVEAVKRRWAATSLPRSTNSRSAAQGQRAALQGKAGTQCDVCANVFRLFHDKYTFWSGDLRQSLILVR